MFPLKPSITLVDDFYEDLDWVIPHLEKAEPFLANIKNYPGRAFAPPAWSVKYALDRIQAKLGGEALCGETPGEMRLLVAADSGSHRSLVHVDNSYNVLIYLAGDEGKDGGTTFYRHRDLGISFADAADKRLRKLNFFLSDDTNNLDRWEAIEHVPFKLNRAVFFNGRYFHAAPQVYYGTSAKDGRITQNFFFPGL